MNLVENVAEEIGVNSDCLPKGDKVSFKPAFNACQLRFPLLTQTQYINGLLHYLSVSFESSDVRLRPCGQLLGVNHLTMKSGRLNALSLVSDFRKNSQFTTNI